MYCVPLGMPLDMWLPDRYPVLRGEVHAVALLYAVEVEEIVELLQRTVDAQEDVKKVVSHPQALGQCDLFIEKHNFETEDAANTAIAAKNVGLSGDKTIAAIGSVEAAEKFGLSVLAAHINESNTNTTRFAVFSRSAKSTSEVNDRFIMLFTVKNAAGSLGKAISVIGQHGFNLKALKSRPTKELVWNYFFYVEGEGNIDSWQGKAMLEELEKCCSNLKVVGTYEKEIHI